MATISGNGIRGACYKNSASKADLVKLHAITATAAQINALTAVATVTKAVTVATMTDNTNTTGYIDFATGAIPALSLVLGWKFVASGAFKGDTSAVVQVGIAGNLDLYSATTSGSVFAAATVGSVVKTTGVFFQLAAATPRITITTASDFTSIVTDATGAGTCTMFYIPLTT
jgi:hypothetical protein